MNYRGDVIRDTPGVSASGVLRLRLGHPGGLFGGELLRVEPPVGQDDASFAASATTRPVRRGEIQGPGLGLSVEVWTEDAKKAPTGEKGELVCTKPFTAMPLQFWNDPGDVKYKSA